MAGLVEKLTNVFKGKAAPEAAKTPKAPKVAPKAGAAPKAKAVDRDPNELVVAAEFVVMVKVPRRYAGRAKQKLLAYLEAKPIDIAAMQMVIKDTGPAGVAAAKLEALDVA